MLKHIESFGQFQGQIGATFRSSLEAAGFSSTQGVAMAVGRYDDTSSIQLQLAAGEAGTNWSNRVTTITATLNGVAFGVDRFVAVGVGGAMCSSADTIAWVNLPNDSAVDLYDVQHAEGLWVAVGGSTDSGGSQATIKTSIDGENWTDRTAPNSDACYFAVTRAAGLWLAVGVSGGVAHVVQSLDGAAWTVVPGITGGALHAVRYLTGQGWIFGGAASLIVTSPDLVTFTPRTFGGTSITIRYFAFNGTTLVGGGTTSVRSSNDFGVTWAAVAGMPAADINAAIFAESRWTFVGKASGGNAPRIISSTNLTTFVQATLTGAAPLNDIVVGSGAQQAWVCVGGTGAITVSLGPPTTLKRTFTSTASKVVFGFAFKASQRARILSIAGVCNIEWPGPLGITTGANPAVLGEAIPVRNVWYYYEITIDKTANTINLHVNDTDDITVPLTAPGAAITSYELTWQVENGSVGNVADLYFLDNTGGEYVERLKPIRLQYRRPTSDVTTEWDASTTGSHADIVGTLPSDPARYISSNVSGAQDLYESSQPLPVGAGTVDMPVIAVGLVALASKTDIDNRQLGLAVGDGPDQLEVIDTTLSLAPEYSYAVFETAPGGGAWDATNAVNEPFGVIVRP